MLLPVGQVACLGPNGIAAQLLALQDLLRWPHPKVTVFEIPDLDDGTPAYEDDLIRVWAVAKPAVPWHGPRMPSVDTKMDITGQAGSPGEAGSAGGSESGACTSDSSKDPAELANTAQGSAAEGEPVPDAWERIHHPCAEAEATTSIGDSGTSSEEVVDSDCEFAQQMRVFETLDSVLASKGSPAEVFAAMKQARVNCNNSLAPKRRREPDQASDVVKPRGQKPSERCPVDAVKLQNVPKRSRHSGAEQPAWDAIKEPKSTVRIARNAAGSIGKHADGATAFVVFVKHSCRWILLNFAAEVTTPRSDSFPAQHHMELTAHASSRPGQVGRESCCSSSQFRQPCFHRVSSAYTCGPPAALVHLRAGCVVEASARSAYVARRCLAHIPHARLYLSRNLSGPWGAGQSTQAAGGTPNAESSRRHRPPQLCRSRRSRGTRRPATLPCESAGSSRPHRSLHPPAPSWSQGLQHVPEPPHTAQWAGALRCRGRCAFTLNRSLQTKGVLCCALQRATPATQRPC